MPTAPSRRAGEEGRAPKDRGRAQAARSGAPGTIKIGTCSWTDPTLLGSGWYPERIAKKADERLRYYAERFPIVENDASYYALPDPKQATLWKERTPDGFTMSFKAFATMTTHPTDPKRLPKDLKEGLPKEALEKRRLYPKDMTGELREEIFARFWVALEPLRKAGKLGAILLQYPEWFVISRQNKEAIVEARELIPDDRLAIEFRNATWMSERNREETFRFLSDNGLTYVCVDEPQGFPSSVPPVTAVTDPRLAIIRFHGHNAENWKKPGLTAAERFDYRYSKEELAAWAPRIRDLARDADEVHALMNNCYGDKAVNNARELAELLAARD